MDTNHVTLSGVVRQRPHASETQQSVPTCRFFVTVTRRWKDGQRDIDIESFCVGHAANSISKYWIPGIEILVTGRLDLIGPEPERLYVWVTDLGFPSVSQCQCRDGQAE